MKLLERVAAYGLLVLAALFALHQYGNARAERALAEQRADSLSAARQHLLALEVNRHAADSVARDSLAKLSVRVVSLKDRADALNRHADSLAADLRAVLGGVRGASFDTLLAVKNSVISMQSETIRQLQAGIMLLDARWAAADSAANAWKVLADNAQGQLAAAIKRGNGPRCIWGPGAAAGYHGYAAGLGVVCRI